MKDKKPTTYKKNLDNIKLLFSDDEFKELIKEIREKLEIYYGEFNKNPDSFKTWYNKIIEESDKISLSKEFILEEKEIKKNFKNKKITKKETIKQMDLLYERMPINYLNYKIGFIIKKFNLPDNYKYHIEKYILFGKKDSPSKKYSFINYPPFKSDTITIKIYNKLTDKEFKELQKDINYYTDRLLPNYQPIKNIDKDLETEELYKTREFQDDEDKYKIKLKEIAQESLGSSKKEKDVHDIARRMKKLRKKRFHRNSENS